jgi:hypothetical protein
MKNLLLKNIKSIYVLFLHFSQNPFSGATQNQSFKLNTKKSSQPTYIFTSLFSFTMNTITSLFSLQKINYVGLHLASAAR